MKKSVISLLLIFVLALALSACGKSDAADGFTVHGLRDDSTSADEMSALISAPSETSTAFAAVRRTTAEKTAEAQSDTEESTSQTAEISSPATERVSAEAADQNVNAPSADEKAPQEENEAPDAETSETTVPESMAGEDDTAAAGEKAEAEADGNAGTTAEAAMASAEDLSGEDASGEDASDGINSGTTEETSETETEYIPGCEYSIIHSGNYATEYYHYELNGNTLTCSCGFCGKELCAIDLIAMVQAELDATNRERAAVGLNDLTLNQTGLTVSSRRAEEIRSDFSHNGFFALSDADLSAIGYVNACGENLCMFGFNPVSADAGNYANVIWMNSDDHRDNILNPAYTTVSISVSFDQQNGCLYWVQLFGG